ncbi:ash family protein [Enterobacteriaceae bacterium 4M9]|nr:ash family protein [Enterobacteriaceae bacterium 4M9]
MNQPHPQKALYPGLRSGLVPRYSFAAVAKSAAGRRNPCNSQATTDAPCVFFFVVVQAQPYFEPGYICRGSCQIMVVRAGQPSGWPVFCETGIPTPVRVTTHERRNSGGGNNRYSQEVALMATTLIPSRPQFIFVFAAVRRAQTGSSLRMLRTVATSEYLARRSLAPEYVLSLAARLPFAEVRV